jgi:hypothetical protein
MDLGFYSPAEIQKRRRQADFKKNWGPGKPQSLLHFWLFVHHADVDSLQDWEVH